MRLWKIYTISTENNKGPSIEPWGIPHGMLARTDNKLSEETTKLVGGLITELIHMQIHKSIAAAKIHKSI